jgi:hypothetical protein
MHDPCFPPPADQQGFRQITPTDIAQFIRLDQCERYLRLRLHERAFGSDFMKAYGVVPQSIPTLLTRSGSNFEMLIETAVRRAAAASQGWLSVYNFATDQARAAAWTEDNEEIVERASRLPAGHATVLFQPRVMVDVRGWRIRGDIDILRLERAADGRLHALIADMKSSTAAKVEHRLQVAFYHEMLRAVAEAYALPLGEITMGVLYRGPADGEATLNDEQRAEYEAQRALAERWLGTREGLLELVPDGQHYLGAVEDLVTGEKSTALRVAQAGFHAVPYHLTYKCDGCLYNEFCMKWCAEHDDLSLIPHLTLHDKTALNRCGVMTTRALAEVLEPMGGNTAELAPAPGREDLAATLAATWPVGPRLVELVHRARHYRKWKGDPVDAITWIPSKGYGSLPYSDAQQNPNLVRVFIDAQHDYLHDRLYMLGALLVGNEEGVPHPQRRRSIVTITDGPPLTPEHEGQLLVKWLREVLQALAEVAAPDAMGEPCAPIHLIFFNSFEQRIVLDALSRHFTTILESAPLYDFMTQLAGFDSPLVTFLDQEIRELTNYPMVCQSMQAVAAFLGFDWNAPEPYRQRFRVRMFDFWGKLDAEDGTSAWYTSRARFNSQIPLEYAYAAWGDLDTPEDADRDDYRRYQGVTPEQLTGFHARRLEALEHIANTFMGNKQTVKTPFRLPDLRTFDTCANTLAQALYEFTTIERHVELAAWRHARLAPPERRVLAGETLIVRYVEDDQEPGVAEQNRDNERRRRLQEQYRAAYRAQHPDARRVTLPPDQRKESSWSQEGMRFWLRVETDGVGCSLDEVLGLTTLREDAPVVIYPRWTVDGRLAEEEQCWFTPTPKQLLYGMRATLKQIVIEHDSDGRAANARILIELAGTRRGGRKGYVFGTIDERPLEPERVYTLDSDPSAWYASYCADVAEALTARANAERHTLYRRLTGEDDSVTWPPSAVEGQARFMAGLEALHAAGVPEAHAFEPSKQRYIGSSGDVPMLLVQGPPGTGKSYSTAFAILARLQGAMAAGLPLRVLLSCKTHAATDVLLTNVREAQARLADWFSARPDLCRDHFDERLTSVPLFRFSPRDVPVEPIIPLPRDRDKEKGAPTAMTCIEAEQWCVVGSAPAGVRGAILDRWKIDLFGHHVIDLVVLDEASQMNLPEAMLATLPLKPDGQLIVVGDHRQMPPIVKHDWDTEPRRTFQEYRTYQSLFDTLRLAAVPIIQFQESFRLHADMAAFLRREIYAQDRIHFHSRRVKTLPPIAHADAFVASVLAPEHTIVVVVHDEATSQLRNAFERELMAPVLEELVAQGYDADEGLGVVVPHRAQRADLQNRIASLTVRDPETGAVRLSAVETVERFQGDEREVIVVSATESDQQYLLVSSKFLLDPRRLTVALSRAKLKMILVASRSVFNLFSADEETFANVQLWKSLLRTTCTVPLWEGSVHDINVQVWGSVPGSEAADSDMQPASVTGAG